MRPAKAEKTQTTTTSNNTEDQNVNPLEAAKKRKEAILAMATVAEVEAALEGETAKSVKEAGAKRIAELKEKE